MGDQMVPALRFPEFNGEWELGLLGDYYKNLRTGMTPYRGIQEYYQGNILWITSGELNYGLIYDTNEKITEKAVLETNLKIYPSGTFFIAITGLEAAGTRGKCAINAIPATTNQSCMAFVQNERINTDFLFYWYLKYAIKLYHKYAQGTKQQSFNNKLVEKFQVIIPNKLEQQKIADFLSSVDKKIEQLTRKKELLEKYKTGMMHKLFPKAGEQHPELRFKDENGQDFPDWDVRKVGDIAQIFRGASPRPISSPKWFSNDSLIGWVRISDVTKSKKYLHKTEQYLSNEGVNKSRFIEPESLIMSICATIGQPIYTKFPVCIHDGFVVFSQPKINPEYLYYYLEKIKYSWHRYGQPGTQINLNSDIVRNENISIPNDPEQQKIADFLSAIDDKITKVEGKLTKAQTFKKGLLQQMFV